MALKIVWTTQANKGLNDVLEYLEEEWSVAEILMLEQNLRDLLTRISIYSKIYPETGMHKKVYKGLVDKNNYLVYRILPSKKQIEIINFRGMKQEPLV